MKLYLVRHGETTYNADGRVQGHQDPPLTDIGIRQAEAIAERLARERFTAVYSSDLQRASETAKLIAAPHGLAVRETPLLRESRLGVVEGLTRREIEERYPTADHEWRANPLTMRPPGAETIEQVIERCRTFLQQILSDHEDSGLILIVAHGGSARGLVIAALDLPVQTYRQMHFANASLSILDAGDRPALWLLNDTCHLDAIRTDEEEIDSIAH